MKISKTYSALLTISFLLFVAYCLASAYYYGFKVLFERGVGFGISYLDRDHYTYSALVKVFAIIKIISLVLLLLGAYQLYRIFRMLIDKAYFNPLLGKNLCFAGSILILYGLITFFCIVIVNMIMLIGMKTNQIEFDDVIQLSTIFSISSLSGSLLSLFIGLFLLQLGSAFYSANEIKSENDLTI